jgi:hypothetical protein
MKVSPVPRVTNRPQFATQLRNLSHHSWNYSDLRVMGCWHVLCAVYQCLFCF